MESYVNQQSLNNIIVDGWGQGFKIQSLNRRKLELHIIVVEHISDSQAQDQCQLQIW